MKISIKKLAVSLCLTGALLFSAVSCGVLEIRDATSEMSPGEEMQTPVLEQAERYNEVEKSEDVESTTGNTETAEDPESTENQEIRIRLTAAGGVAIDNHINADAASRANGEKEYSFLTMYAGIYPLIRNSDISLVTLEAPCADNDTYPVNSEDTVNMPIEALIALSDLGFDVINTAGTHLMDCCDDGVKSTVEKVCDTEVLQIGAYQDDIDANDVRVYEQDGIRIAFVSYMEEAPESTMVVPDLTDLETVQSGIAYADLIADVVVVSITWNGEDNGKRQEFAKNLAEYGADIIIGCDGSTLDTAEWITSEDGTKTFVAYSLGNLISTGRNAESLVGGVLSLDIVAKDESIVLENVTVNPIVTHYSEEYTYQVLELRTYADDMASTHAVQDLTAENLQQIAASVIPAEFLPKE